MVELDVLENRGGELGRHYVNPLAIESWGPSGTPGTTQIRFLNGTSWQVKGTPNEVAKKLEPPVILSSSEINSEDGDKPEKPAKKGTAKKSDVEGGA